VSGDLHGRAARDARFVQAPDNAAPQVVNPGPRETYGSTRLLPGAIGKGGVAPLNPTNGQAQVADRMLAEVPQPVTP